MFTEIVPIDPYFETAFAGQIEGVLKGAGFDEIDESISVLAVREISRLKNFCNTDFVPVPLYYLISDMILGAYLERMYQTGNIPDGFDVDYIGSRVTLGDATVEFKGGESLSEKSEKKLLALIDSLQSNWKKEAVTCRRLKW